MTPGRCAAESLAAEEPLLATAPTDTRWLLLEHAGGWGRAAVAESRLPAPVRAHLAALSAAGTRVQLIRRHGAAEPAASGLSVLSLDLAAPTPVVRRARLEDPHDVVGLDVESLPVSHDPSWLVCTNGGRDVCCAERGRPVTAALAARWPAQTWETTHLGGHRFAATLLALPSGVVLGRVEPGTVATEAAALLVGHLTPHRLRGRAGLDPAAQAAEQHLRVERDLWGLHDVRAEPAGPTGRSSEESVVRVRVRRTRIDLVVDVAVLATPGPHRRASCTDEVAKPGVRWSTRTLSETPVR